MGHKSVGTHSFGCLFCSLFGMPTLGPSILNNYTRSKMNELPWELLVFSHLLPLGIRDEVSHSLLSVGLVGSTKVRALHLQTACLVIFSTDRTVFSSLQLSCGRGVFPFFPCSHLCSQQPTALFWLFLRNSESGNPFPATNHPLSWAYSHGEPRHISFPCVCVHVFTALSEKGTVALLSICCCRGWCCGLSVPSF